MFVQLQKEFLGRKPGKRFDVSETDANGLSAKQLAIPVTDDLITPAIQRAMEAAFAGFQKGLVAVINAQLTAFQNAQKAEGRRRKAEGRRRKAEGGRQKAEGRRQRVEGRRHFTN